MVSKKFVGCYLELGVGSLNCGSCPTGVQTLGVSELKGQTTCARDERFESKENTPSAPPKIQNFRIAGRDSTPVIRKSVQQSARFDFG